MELFETIRKASRTQNALSDKVRSEILRSIGKSALDNASAILGANQADCARMDPSDPRYDRLLLTEERIATIAKELLAVADLPSPLNKLLDKRTLPNGLELEKITVPLGVVGVIYEARPNVTLDVFGICFKSGNACVLKGGSDAEESNLAIVKTIKETLQGHGLDPNLITLLPSDRQSAHLLMDAVGYVDVIIPRGGKNLIDFVRNNSKVPTIETGAGIVHMYVDESANVDTATSVVFNAKTRRVSVCNALDCLLLHTEKLPLLSGIVGPLAEKNVIIYADPQAYGALKGHYPDNLLHQAQDHHYGIEFLDYKMSIRTVTNLEEALNHISVHSSKHSEAIIAQDKDTIASFLNEVDAAAVYVNASTAFTDGAQFGLGAEIGISTQKLHARGPMALNELTSYKWIIRGQGQIRP